MPKKFSTIALLILLSAQVASAQITEIRLSAGGDFIPHETVFSSLGENSPATLFENVQHLLRSSDLVFCNLETPLVPKSFTPQTGPTRFAAPAELANSLRAVGFNIVSVANNHILDQGEIGLRTTVEALRNSRITPIGAGAASEPYIAHVNGVRIGFLAFTEFINVHDAGRLSDQVNSLNMRAMTKTLQALRDQVDLICLSMHWGKEFCHVPTEQQKVLARKFIESGADLILGHHPHMVQPVEIYPAPSGRTGVIAYSLGNLVGYQNRTSICGDSSNSKIGLLFEITYEKQSDSSAIQPAKIALHPIEHRIHLHQKNLQYSVTEAENNGRDYQTVKWLFGDLDGDGIRETVEFKRKSHVKYYALGYFLISSPQAMQADARSPIHVGPFALLDMELADVDGDRRMEICLLLRQYDSKDGLVLNRLYLYHWENGRLLDVFRGRLFQPEIKDFAITHASEGEGDLIDTIGFAETGMKWIRYKWYGFGLYGVAQRTFPSDGHDGDVGDAVYLKGLLRKVGIFKSDRGNHEKD
jgi:poly-gamma-glutamate capsule biosynthesis protein CapA/YwtB (metallophosphatase superfamily)